MLVLEVASLKKVSHTVKVLVKDFILYFSTEVVGNKIESIEPSDNSRKNFERLSLHERAETKKIIADHITQEYPKAIREEMLKNIFVKTGGREENPEIATICANIALK